MLCSSYRSPKATWLNPCADSGAPPARNALTSSLVKLRFMPLYESPDRELKRIPWMLTCRCSYVCQRHLKLRLPTDCISGCSGSVHTLSEVIGIDLGTTNSCVAVLEGKVCLNCSAVACSGSHCGATFCGAWCLRIQHIRVRSQTNLLQPLKCVSCTRVQYQWPRTCSNAAATISAVSLEVEVETELI
jgi:hypothetical protein